MDSPHGRVIAIECAEPAPRAVVEVDAAISCARCAEGKGCGAGLLGGDAGHRRVEALIGNGLTLSEGDEVRIELAPSSLLQASVIVYGWPLTGMIAGAAVARFVGPAEVFIALSSLGGLLVGAVAARRRLRASHCIRRFTPMIVERLSVGQ